MVDDNLKIPAAPLNAQPPLGSEFPDWAWAQLRLLAAAEPRLGAQLELEGAGFGPFRVEPLGDPLFRCFDENKAALQPAPLAIFVFSWLKKGGAEFVGANLVREAQKSLGIENVLVIGLDWDVTEAQDWFEPGTRFFVALRDAPYLSRDQRLVFVRDYIVQSRPLSVFNCNSWIMWDILANEGAALSTVTRLYAFAFCFDYTPSGVPVGYPASHLPQALPFLAGVLSDNAGFKDILRQTFGFPPSRLERMTAIYQPIEMPHDSFRLSADGLLEERPKVLWASRICRQKRPELLVQIARLRPQYDFELYGDFYEADIYGPDFFNLPNIRYRGWYDTLKDIPYAEMSAFLYTSMYDGMPNIVLAAGALGMPIVTADIGGIAETVTQDCGWLVHDHRDPEAYALALDEAVGDKQERARRAAALFINLSHKHSRRSYEEQVLALGLFDV